MKNVIESWEQEISENEQKEKALYEASIYNFYGETPVVETVESILEFTQKQLLDPKFIDKMKAKRLKFDSAADAVSICLGILFAAIPAIGGIASGSVISGFGFLVLSPTIILFVMVTLGESLKGMSAKIYNKNEAKYQKQFEELKRRCKNAIEKDKKNASSYKQILTKIEKIEKDKAEEARRWEEAAKKENLDYTIACYKTAVDMINGKYNFEDIDDNGYEYYDALCIADDYLKFPENKMFDMLLKDCNIVTAEKIFGKEDAHRYGFKSGDKLIELNLNPDEIWVVDINKRKIVYIDSEKDIDRYSLYNWVNDMKDGSYDIDEAIEEADKYLGYYRVAKCPDQVTPRPLTDTNSVKEEVEFINIP